MNVHCLLLDDSSYAYDLILQDWRELGNLIGMNQYNYLYLSSLSMDSSDCIAFIHVCMHVSSVVPFVCRVHLTLLASVSAF